MKQDSPLGKRPGPMSRVVEGGARYVLTITLASLLTGSYIAVAQPTPFDQAVDAIGGEDGLTSLTLLQIDSKGTVRVDYESPRPSEPVDVSSYTTRTTFNFSNDHLRMDTERTPLFEALQFFPP